jgi:Domain of unknown function (DUF4112)
MGSDSDPSGKPGLLIPTAHAGGSRVLSRPLAAEAIPGLSPSRRARQSPVAQLDRLSYVMERWFAVPGTRLRFGLNTILLLLPVVGDLVSSVVSVAILIVGLKNYRVPRIVAARMVANACLDSVLGWIPILGDLFDLFFKADTQNVRLLQEYAREGQNPPRALWRHWAFVIGVLILLTLVGVLIGIGFFALVRWMTRVFRAAAVFPA